MRHNGSGSLGYGAAKAPPMCALRRQPTSQQLIRQKTCSLSRALQDEATDVDREITHNLWKHHRMLPPASRFRHYWDYVMILLTLYNFLLTPMQLGYSRGPVFRSTGDVPTTDVLLAVDCLIWVVFVCDLVVNMRTAYYDAEHELVVSSALVWKRYCDSWFTIDLLGSLPYALLAYIFTIGQSDPTRTLVIAVAKMPLCLRMLRLSHKLDEMSSTGYSHVMLQMLAFILVAHWVGSLWWFIGVSQYEERHDPYITPLAGALPGEIGEARFLRDGGKTWLGRVPVGSTPLSPNLTHTPFEQQYVSSLYWALTTLMKTSWVGPDTVLEKVYASGGVILGVIVFAMLLGNVSAMINSYNKRHSELRDVLTTLHNFATFRRVPAGLQRKMFAYIDAYWNMTAGLEQLEILNSLPAHLRNSVLGAVYEQMLEDCSMLRGVSRECAMFILSRVLPQVVLQKEDLLVPGQIATDVHVLITGSLQITLPTTHDDKALSSGRGCSEYAAGWSQQSTAGALTVNNRQSHGMRLSTRCDAAPGTTTTTTAAAAAGAAAATRPSFRKGQPCTRSHGQPLGNSRRLNAAASSAALKGDRLRFRVLEKPGQIVGLAEPFQQPTTFPFRVNALKTSHMIYIPRADLADVLSIFHGVDADHVCHMLRTDFMMSRDTLKPRVGSAAAALAWESTGLKGGDSQKQMFEIVELREKLDHFEQRLDGCISKAGAVVQQAALLPEIHEALVALVHAHTEAPPS